MESNSKKDGTVKVAENQTSIEKELAGEVVKPLEKKKQAISITYTLRSVGDNIGKLAQMQLINGEEEKNMREALTNALMRYTGITK